MNEEQNEEFTIVRKIGEGTFSTVFLAEDAETKRSVAIKQLTKTVSPTRVATELTFLRELKGEKNVIELISASRKNDDMFIVFPYVEGSDFKEFILTRTVADIKHYMFELLTALQHVHAQDIIHRDIKPGNFLYDARQKKGYLIDFGLSQRAEKKVEEVVEKKRRFFFSSQSVSKNNRASMPRPPPGYAIRDSRPPMAASRSGTRGFRAPEVLLRVDAQTTAIDVWSAGVILLSLLTRKYPFFSSKDDINAIVELGSIFGDKEMRGAAKHYKRIWKSNIKECLAEKMTFKEVTLMCSGKEEDLPAALFDLLEKMLALKANERITAEEALRHKFFIQ
ncbi:cell division control protein 7 [Nematocida displodere]|uniref:non-specific serine/threonine protein kinase n=1 Tax=Nematocida displodere TaxID=1805483 RepID=A0A177EIM2_9MICR|nr:cell division control protein 7 [Nematocida displodere]